MKREFALTEVQRDLLTMAVRGAFSCFGKEGAVVGSLIKRGLVKRLPGGGAAYYEITPLGRAVARQLGIAAENGGAQ